MTQTRYQAVKKVTYISATTNCLLAIFKVIIGYLGNSHALIADGLHSFSDLLSDGLVFFAAKAGGRLPDEDHPYGHQRIETVGAILIALLLLGIAGGIIYESLSHLIERKPKEILGFSVLLVALVSIFANEGLYRYTLFVGKKIKSNLLITNAWHNRSDAFVSLIVLVSVVGSLLGFHYLDVIGALIIAGFIIKIAFKMLWGGTRELIDTGVDNETLAQIQQHIKQVPGVQSVHQLRTRLHGSNILVDVHIIVDPRISVSEGHHIGEQVHLHLAKKFENISDVTVHIDPEDDEKFMPSILLPTRSVLIEQLKKVWQNLPAYNDISNIQLHYLDGKLHIELYFPQTKLAQMDAEKLAKAYRNAVHDQKDIANITLHGTITAVST